VLQEAALAPINLAMLGTLEIELVPLLRAMIWFQRQTSGTTNLEARQGNVCVKSLFDYADRKQGNFATNTLTSAESMFNARSFKKYEPRGAIYAVRALIRPGVRVPCSVDYHKPLREVLQMATRAAMSETGELTLIERTYHLPGNETTGPDDVPS
jgi:hypothetical protein